MLNKFSNQRGAIPLLILLAAAGLLIYIFISSTASFKDKLFDFLYPKPKSHAASLGNVYFVDSLGNQINTTSSATVAVKLSPSPWPSVPPQISTSSAGPKNPGAASTIPAYFTRKIGKRTETTKKAWTQTSSVLTSDDRYAQYLIGSNEDKFSSLIVNNFGLNIPANAKISGISVEVEKRSKLGRIIDFEVKLIKKGGQLSANKASAAVWPRTDQIASYGSPSDLWSASWTAQDINDPSFGVSVSAKVRPGVNGGDSALIDNIRVKVVYTVTVIPPGVVTKSVVLAEDDKFTVNTKQVAIATDSATFTLDYTFSDPGIGTKSLYAKFAATNGSQQNGSPFPATITLVPAGAKKVLLLIYNPVIESQGNKKLVDLRGWNNPGTLTQQFIDDVKQSSSGNLVYFVTQRVELDDYPVKTDGFKYTDETYLNCVNSRGSSCHSSDPADYKKMIDAVDACGKVNRGEIDELWIWGGPWFGYWEANLAGPNAFSTNSPPTARTTCQKLLSIMGFNYERGEPEMFEDLAHRAEGTFTQVFGGWSAGYGVRSATIRTPWDKFSIRDSQNSGNGGCGNAHMAVNADPQKYTGYDYDRENTRIVKSSCDDFLNYPNLAGVSKDISCSAWGCNSLGYLKWWFAHLPKVEGQLNSRFNNWWVYLKEPDKALGLPPYPTPTPSPSAVPTSVPTSTPVAFSNLSATSSLNNATFNFTYSGITSSYHIDLSTVSDMSWDVYGNFATGVSSPVTISNPNTKWAKYTCGKQLYWKVYNDDGSQSSPVQSLTVYCSAPFVDLSSKLASASAIFNFTSQVTNSSYHIDLSSVSDMSWDVYLDFGAGSSSPIIIAGPNAKWAKYTCGKTLYWKVLNSDRTKSSSIQTSQVTCP